jgi:hypothetical protein
MAFSRALLLLFCVLVMVRCMPELSDSVCWWGLVTHRDDGMVGQDLQRFCMHSEGGYKGGYLHTTRAVPQAIWTTKQDHHSMGR